MAILLIATGCGSDRGISPMAPVPSEMTSLASPPIVSVLADAVITNINDPGALLGGVLIPGDTLLGDFRYDETVPDAHKKPDSGRYLFRDPPTGATFSASGLSFQSDPISPSVTIKLLNDKNGKTTLDSFELRSASNADALPGVGVSTILLTLEDDSATALDDDALAGLGLNFSDWTNGTVTITGPGWRIDAILTPFFDGTLPIDHGNGGRKDYIHNDF